MSKYYKIGTKDEIATMSFIFPHVVAGPLCNVLIFPPEPNVLRVNHRNVFKKTPVETDCILRFIDRVEGYKTSFNGTRCKIFVPISLSKPVFPIIIKSTKVY